MKQENEYNELINLHYNNIDDFINELCIDLENKDVLIKKLNTEKESIIIKFKENLI